MPAAAWAAKSGDSILFTQRDVLPEPTRSAILLHERPRIYVLGPPSAISAGVVTQLGRLGAVTRISGAEPAGVRRSRSRASPTARSAGASSIPATGWCS